LVNRIAVKEYCHEQTYLVEKERDRRNSPFLPLVI
jgi:hypothetical protein